MSRTIFPRRPRHLDLFSGIGGFALAAEWAGFNTVGFCEIDKECQKVLNRHWPNIPIVEDIRSFDANYFSNIDIVTGGYPCQPFSVAGNQKAEKDDRHLWPYMLGVITQTRPTWVVCENVYGHIKLGLDNVLHDLEGEGYSAQPFVIPSLATGRNHTRQRVFIVAHSSGDGFDGGSISGRYGKANEGGPKGKNSSFYYERCRSLRAGVDWKGRAIGRWGTEPPPLRVDDELPGRAHRVEMIGNAIDPVIAFEIFKCFFF